MSRLSRRVALAAITVWLVSAAVFLLMRLGPGDPVSAALSRGDGGMEGARAEQLREDLGLNRPLLVQYANWLWGLVRLDPGRSIATGRHVTVELGPRILLTLELAFASAIVAGLAGCGLGLAASWSSRGLLDRVVLAAILVLLSTPAFWLGLLIVIGSAAWFGVLPGSGYSSFTSAPVAHVAAIAPAVGILALRPAGLVARVVRSGAFDVAGQGFVLAARARGVTRWRVASRHVFRVGALPAVPVLGVQAVYLLGGSVVVEQVFGLPGLGRAMLDAVSARDYPVVQFLVVLFACAAVVASLVADMVQSALDPRVRR